MNSALGMRCRALAPRVPDLGAAWDCSPREAGHPCPRRLQGQKGVGRRRAVSLTRASWAWPGPAGTFDPTTVSGIGPVTAEVLLPLYRDTPGSAGAARGR
ncbi:MAG TPA: hypothetical protein QF730_00410 [Planctomycetota bacterium]|nr:hypothetical protein [Planctomycetota bacterium]